MNSYLLCTGTRPEIIKMAPVYRSLKERGAQVSVLHTGQHLDMAQSLYRFFDMEPDHDLHLKRLQPGLAQLTAELLQGVDRVLGSVQPDAVLVQGDTSSALVGALAAYFRDIPVAHIEAGLRTGLHDPFPEEKHRELIGRLAHWHFPPTAQASDNLRHEGIAQQHIFEVGNTVIDAALWVRQRLDGQHLAPVYPPPVQQVLAQVAPARLMLVTAHRRENWGRPIQRIAAAVGSLLQAHPDLVVVWPLHPNPQVRQDVQAVLQSLHASAARRLCLTDPLDYPALIGLLSQAYVCLTDSGGIQEEASAFRLPVLISRDHTERQELVQAGGARLVGTDPHAIVEHVSALLQDRLAYRAMQLDTCPFGDGHSAARIADVLTGHMAPPRPLPPQPSPPLHSAHAPSAPRPADYTH